MKMTIEELKARIWEDLGLNDRSVIFCHFATEYGDGIGGGLIESTDDLFDCDRWFDFCYNEVPNVPSVAMSDCISYLLGDGEADYTHLDDVDCLDSLMHGNRRVFFKLLDEYADVLATIQDEEVPNPAYDVLEDEDDE